MDHRELEDRLTRDWDGAWGRSQILEEEIRPPANSPQELREYLVELGVLNQRTKDRSDVPDLYAFGLGVKRKGGVRRK